MKQRFFLLMILIMTGLGFMPQSGMWQKNTKGLSEPDVRFVKVGSGTSGVIYAGTSKALYRAEGRSGRFVQVLKPSGRDNGVNDIFINDNEPRTIYAATDAGMFESDGRSVNWNRIYFSSDQDARTCLAVYQYGESLYLGTGKGLFKRRQDGSGWFKLPGFSNNGPVYHIAHDHNYLYWSSAQFVYRMDELDGSIKKIFSAGLARAEGDQILDAPAETADISPLIKEIATAGNGDQAVLAGSPDGIFLSLNHGESWKRLPVNNLAADDLTSFTVVKNKNCRGMDINCFRLIAGTHKGVFFLDQERWLPLYKGMATNDISRLANDERGTLYAATARGVYFLDIEETLPLLSKTSTSGPAKSKEPPTGPRDQIDFNNEPGINEVHQWAIEYAEVNNDKIKSWRALAKRKALMPDLSVGLDRDAGDLFHWNTGASPDELQKGRELLDWDVSLSWDLADMIWSTDQTTIDSRAKLMVELREDILNEVTRLYFERRRAQIDLASGSLLMGQTQIDYEMRIAELTALIDAFTGGEFSRRIVDKQ